MSALRPRLTAESFAARSMSTRKRLEREVEAKKASDLATRQTKPTNEGANQ